jgi:hypothetical protein
LFLPLTEDIQQKAKEILVTHPTLVDIKRRKSGADLFLIAAAIVRGGIVVTQEKLRGGSPKVVKIPHVCEAYGVRCIPLLALLQQEGSQPKCGGGPSPLAYIPPPISRARPSSLNIAPKMTVF